jgi:hypothetical protein
VWAGASGNQAFILIAPDWGHLHLGTYRSGVVGKQGGVKVDSRRSWMVKA